MISTSVCVTGLDRAGLVISQRKLSSTVHSSNIKLFLLGKPSLRLYLPAVSEIHIIVNIEQLPMVLHITGMTKVINIIAKVLSGRLTVGLLLQGEG